jgi:hypothetical protein
MESAARAINLAFRRVKFLMARELTKNFSNSELGSSAETPCTWLPA